MRIIRRMKTVESARAEIQNEDSRLPFLSNATHIYDDYIHFLVEQGKSDEALAAADQSRARTLAQGLGLAADKPVFRPACASLPLRSRKKGGAERFFSIGWVRNSRIYGPSARRKHSH